MRLPAYQRGTLVGGVAVCSACLDGPCCKLPSPLGRGGRNSFINNLIESCCVCKFERNTPWPTGIARFPVMVSTDTACRNRGSKLHPYHRFSEIHAGVSPTGSRRVVGRPFRYWVVVHWVEASVLVRYWRVCSLGVAVCQSWFVPEILARRLSENREPTAEKLFWPFFPLIFVKYNQYSPQISEKNGLK